MLPACSLPSMAREGHNLSCHYKKRKRQRGKELDSHFIELQPGCLQAVVPSGGSGYDLVSRLPEKMRAMSQQPGEEAQPTAGPNHATASGTSHKDGRRAETSTSKGLKQGLLAPRPWPSLFSSQSGEGMLHSRGKMGTTLRRKLPLTGVSWKTQSWRQCWS